jgi:hypothetical protein
MDVKPLSGLRGQARGQSVAFIHHGPGIYTKGYVPHHQGFPAVKADSWQAQVKKRIEGRSPATGLDPCDPIGRPQTGNAEAARYQKNIS